MRSKAKGVEDTPSVGGGEGAGAAQEGLCEPVGEVTVLGRMSQMGLASSLSFASYLGCRLAHVN